MKNNETSSVKNIASTSGMFAKNFVLFKHGIQAKTFTQAMLHFQTSTGYALLDQRCRVVECQDQSLSYDIVVCGKNVFLDTLADC